MIGSDRSRQGQGQIHQLLITSIAWAGGPHRPWRSWWRGSWICGQLYQLQASSRIRSDASKLFQENLFLRPSKEKDVYFWQCLINPNICTGCLKKSFTRLQLQIGFRPFYGQHVSKNCFWSFLTKTKQDKAFPSLCIGKFCPTATNFDYDFWAENGLLSGPELGLKIITQIWYSGAIFSHEHDFKDPLIPLSLERRVQPANAQFVHFP